MLTENEIKVLNSIREDISYENYFLKKLKDLKWFFPLKQNGYFLPENAPAREWNFLPYLERVSEQTQIPENEKYAEELLEIINNVTGYHVEHDRKLGNDYIWWHFVKILINIPNDKIVRYLKDNKIDIGKAWIEKWIASKFDNTLSASDIGNKLLPRFLTKKKSDIEIAEGIVKAITEIKWEPLSEERKKSHLETKDAEVRTIVNPFWLIKCFKKNAQKIGKLCGENVVYTIADRLKGILKYEHKDHQADIEFNQDTYRIGATRVEDGEYSVKDFDFHCSVGKLKKSDLEEVKGDIFREVALKPEPLFNFDLENCDSKEVFIKSMKHKLSREDRVVDLTQSEDIDKLKDLYDGLYSDYSYIWFGSLARSPSVGSHEADLMLAIFLRDILLAKCESDVKAGKTIMGKFLGKEYQFPLFRRLVLFVIGHDWTEYGEFFWEFLENNPKAFDESDYEAELYKLLQNNIGKFTDDEKVELKILVDKGPRYIHYEKQEHRIAYWKQKWYSAMKKDACFAKLFKEQKTITNIGTIEPPGRKEIVEHVGWGSSPLTKEDILAFGTNEEVAESLREFKPKKDVWGEPTERGLAGVLRAAVKEKPERFVGDLEPFLGINYLYVHNILHGCEEAWKEKKSFNWEKLFEFAREYINKSGFWKEGKEAQGHDWKVTHIWIINIIADLIQEGTRDDSWAFHEDYFELAEELLDTIIDKLPVEEEEGDRRAVSLALNTSYGHVIKAMILLSLRKARVEDKKNVSWNPSKYERLLGKGVIEAFTLFGQYMPNFTYLNKSWVKERIKEFEALPSEDIRWQSFMEGYLFGPRVYQDLYKLMRRHYLKAIEVGSRQQNAEEQLVDHITIGYLRGNESLEGTDSLFKIIVDKWDYPKLDKVTGFFWSQSRHLVEEGEKKKESESSKKVREKIIGFWRWTYKNRDMINEKLKDDYGRMLSDLSRLTILLDKIDSEDSKWLLLSAPHVGMGSDSSFFIEYLKKFEDRESIRFIGKIFLEMLSAATPTHDEEHIKAIVERIYQFGNKTEADEIYEIYGRRGFEFLRPLYEKYNRANVTRGMDD